MAQAMNLPTRGEIVRIIEAYQWDSGTSQEDARALADIILDRVRAALARAGIES